MDRVIDVPVSQDVLTRERRPDRCGALTRSAVFQVELRAFDV